MKIQEFSWKRFHKYATGDQFFNVGLGAIYIII